MSTITYEVVSNVNFCPPDGYVLEIETTLEDYENDEMECLIVIPSVYKSEFEHNLHLNWNVIDFKIVEN